LPPGTITYRRTELYEERALRGVAY